MSKFKVLIIGSGLGADLAVEIIARVDVEEEEPLAVEDLLAYSLRYTGEALVDRRRLR